MDSKVKVFLDDQGNLVNTIDPELVKGFEPKLT